MFDVIIVGAGLSGLTTAYKILQKEASLKLKILEANGTIGGQLPNRPEGESGIRWITADQYHIFNLLKELRVTMRRRTPISKSLLRCWSLDRGNFAPVAKYELQRYMDELDLKSQLYRSGTYFISPEDREHTMWHHIKAKMFFHGSRMFMKNFVRLVTGTCANEICYIEFMNVVHSCGGIKTLMNLYVDASSKVLEFSSEELLTTLDNKLESVTLITSSKVTEIQQNLEQIEVHEINGNIHSAKVVVLAIPWNKIAEIYISPPTPYEYEMPSTVSKCYVTSFVINYEEAHWRRRGLSGNFYSDDPAIFAQQYKPTCLVGCILHDEGFEVLAKSTVLSTLASCFGELMTTPLEYFQETYEQTSLVNLPRSGPWNQIIWSSTSTATLYRGCLSGAVQSGLRAAVNALLILRPQNVSWQDLAEIQRANAVYRYPAIWSLLKSSVNVYNAVYYTAIGLVIYFLVKKRNKIV